MRLSAVSITLGGYEVLARRARLAEFGGGNANIFSDIWLLVTFKVFDCVIQTGRYFLSRHRFPSPLRGVPLRCSDSTTSRIHPEPVASMSSRNASPEISREHPLGHHFT